MSKITLKFPAQAVSWILHPLLIPSYSCLLLMDYMPGVEYYTQRMKILLVAIVFVSSCLIPLFYGLLSRFNHRLFGSKGNISARRLFYLFTGLSCFLGVQFLGKLPVTNIFRVIMLAACLFLVLIFALSFKWKVSEHTAALGALWGTLIAFNFRYGMNVIDTLWQVSLALGLSGTADIYLEKHTPSEVYLGFGIGAVLFFGFMFFI